MKTFLRLKMVEDLDSQTATQLFQKKQISASSETVALTRVALKTLATLAAAAQLSACGQARSLQQTVSTDASSISKDSGASQRTQTTTTIASLTAFQMTPSTGGDNGDGTWNIWANGTLTSQISFPSSSTYGFDIAAYGSPAQGGWPDMQLLIDGAVAQDFSVSSSSLGHYQVNAAVSGGSHQVAIAFTNDLYSPPEDRNLYVNGMTITLTTTTSTSTSSAQTLNYNGGQFNLLSGQSVSLGSLYFTLQTDGNFVAYLNAGAAAWATSSSADCSNQQCNIIFQTDGNLVIYRNGTPFWASNTSGHSGSSLQLSNQAPILKIAEAYGNGIYQSSEFITIPTSSGPAATPTPVSTPVATPAPTATPVATPAATPTPAPVAGSISGNAYYVAPNGNDSSNGSASAPFQTLAKAQSAAQNSSTKTIVLRGGTYALGSAINLNTSDNGEAWVGYPGETAIVDAGARDAFALDHVTGMKFENLTIQNVSRGIYINDYSSGIVIRWNQLNNCALNCVQSNYYSNNITIDSNTMNGGGSGANDTYGRLQGTYHAAVFVNFGATDVSITHNLIENFQAGAVSVAAGSASESNSRITIDRNVIKNVNTTLSDSGAIYVMDRGHQGTGDLVTNNVIDGNGTFNQSTKCIYLDDDASNVTVTGNINRNCGTYGIQFHGGDHNIVLYNVFDLSSGARLGLYQDDLDPGLNLPSYGINANTFQQNIVYFAAAAPSLLWDYDNNYGGSNVPMAALGITNNLYFSLNGSSIPNGGQVVDPSPKYGNPLFTNAASGNYAMSSSSAAYAQISFMPLVSDQGPSTMSPSLPQ